MKTIDKLFLTAGIFGAISISNALEFGSMGNVSSSVGGAGVALKNSAWGLYYNPALLRGDKRSKVAISLGAGYKEQNLLALTNIDLKNLERLTKTMDSKLIGVAMPAGAVSVEGTGKIDGVAGNMIASLIGSNTLNATSLQNWATRELGITATGGNLAAVGQSIATQAQNDTNLQNKIQNSLSNAAGSAGSPLLQSIINGIDPTKIGDLVSQISKSGTENFDFNKILDSVGAITIARGADSEIDRFLDDYETLNKALGVNDFSLRSQNGLVIQLGSDEGKRGSIAFGVLPQLFLNANATLDPTHREIIIDTGGGKYLNISVTSSGISATNSDASTYDNKSMLSPTAKHRLQTTALVLTEVPVGYAHGFDTPHGELSVGGALKYLSGVGYRLNKEVNLQNTDIEFNASDAKMSSNFGVDLGLLWTPERVGRGVDKKLRLGLVAKNLNAPKMSVGGGEFVRLNRQVRAGVSYDALKWLTLALDADLLPNDTLSTISPKSQTVGGGAIADFKYVDFRLGMLKDFKSNSGEGLIATGGLNLLGFLDLSLQYGLGKSVNVDGTKIPNYLELKLGMQFSW